eukprot:Unigene3978_Nuclearia_a/m.12098 Unigene3978_Nuclearia_a/g.12098  ORF Unigene3978_Nuclearia_a/g.12098 Unigene3978_Nuclearia_a/m.12098 type:complete len:207 (-) Unigene3978_Nuclearia_a:112-732(-)
MFSRSKRRTTPATSPPMPAASTTTTTTTTTTTKVLAPGQTPSPPPSPVIGPASPSPPLSALNIDGDGAAPTQPDAVPRHIAKRGSLTPVDRYYVEKYYNRRSSVPTVTYKTAADYREYPPTISPPSFAPTFLSPSYYRGKAGGGRNSGGGGGGSRVAPEQQAAFQAAPYPGEEGSAGATTTLNPEDTSPPARAYTFQTTQPISPRP